MRKKYIAPEVEIVKTGSIKLLSGSDAIQFNGIDGLDGYGGVDDGTNEPG